MAFLIETGLIADAMLIFLGATGIFLFLYHRKTGRGIPVRRWIWNVLSGGCLVLAFRAALIDAGWGWIALALIGALIFHVLDLIARWTRAS